jgi:DNA-binding response OmpR family regulator
MNARSNSVVAIVNTNDDLVDVLRDALLREGFNVVTLHIRDIKAGRTDFGAFLSAHDPEAVIYDIAVPYEDNWTFLQTLRQLSEAKNREFVVTTVNKRVFEQRIGSSDVIEIQGGRADDLDPVIEAVKRVTNHR